jgi:hypothetical protein
MQVVNPSASVPFNDIQQIQHRDDRRPRKKNLVWSSEKNYSSSSLNKYIGSNFISDSKLEMTVIRHLRAEPQGLNKAKNSLANVCAEIFLSRTSIPYYHGEPSAYPFLASNDADVTSKAKDVWVYLRESSGSLSDTTSHNFTKFKALLFCSCARCAPRRIRSV